MFMTQLESAVAGVVTKEMKVVAEKERMDEEVLRSLVASGKVLFLVTSNILAFRQRGLVSVLELKSMLI